MDFWIQTIGIVAMATNISAYQFKNKRDLLLCVCIGSALFSVNLFLLGAVTGAMTLAFAGNDAKIIRLSGFISSPCWLVYNIFNNAIGGMLCEIITLISIISALIRIDIPKKKRNKLNEKQEKI